MRNAQWGAGWGKTEQGRANAQRTAWCVPNRRVALGQHRSDQRSAFGFQSCRPPIADRFPSPRRPVAQAGVEELLPLGADAPLVRIEEELVSIPQFNPTQDRFEWIFRQVLAIFKANGLEPDGKHGLVTFERKVREFFLNPNRISCFLGSVLANKDKLKAMWQGHLEDLGLTKIKKQATRKRKKKGATTLKKIRKRAKGLKKPVRG